MRIAVFIKSTGLGGLETQNKTLCEGLAKRSHEIVVFAPRRASGDINSTTNGVTYHYVDANYKVMAFLFFNKNNWFIKSVEVFKHEHSARKFDLVISQSSAGLGIIRHKKELGVKVITISHGSTLSEFKTKRANTMSILSRIKLLRDLAYVLYNFFTIQREIVLHSNKTVAVSNFVKNLLIDETFADDKHIEVIYNGVDPELYKKHLVSDSISRPVNLISTSRIVRSKGLFVLIDALQILSDSNWRLSLMGDGEDMAELQKYVVAKGLSSKVNFIGRVLPEKIAEYLLDADIFVLPSIRIEGFPMTVIEAMMASVPVVASKIGGIVDAVDDGITGYLVKPGDVESLTQTLEKLLYNKDARETMGANGRIKAIKEFSLDTMLDKYEAVITALIY